jgi:hypothetical protein
MNPIDLEIQKIAEKSNYFEEIEILKQKYNKTGDEYIGIDNIELSYNRTITLHLTGNPSPNRKCWVYFPNDLSNQMVCKNLRFNNKKWNECIEWCCFECQGYQLDKIYGRIFPTLRYIHNINDESTLPFSFCRDNDYISYPLYHTTRFYFEFNENFLTDCRFELLIDVYDKVNPYHEIKSQEIFQTQFTGEDPAMDKNGKYRFGFHSPISHLIFGYDNAKIEKLDVYLDGRKTVINLDNAIEYDNNYIVPLSKSNCKDGINFSHLSNDIAHVIFSKYQDDGLFYCYALSQNVVRMFDSCELKYSS